MARKSKKPVRKQPHSPTGKVVGQVGQILLPMIAGIAATKADLTEWVYEQGLTALHLLLREDAEEIAGLKGKHEKERTHNHWGSTNGELSFGGRRIQVLPWCTTPIEAESSLGRDSHHPIISLSGIPSAVMVLRILHPILASTLCAANPLVRIAEPTIAL